MQRNRVISFIDRVISFIDGFNLYHAIDNLNQSHLKWLNLHSLSNAFIKPKIEDSDFKRRVLQRFVY